MSAATRELILDAARTTVQAHGYGGLSFRDLAAAVGIKSASVHYHFPTKSDLAQTLARLYTERTQAELEAVLLKSRSRGGRLRLYTSLFRKALKDNNRMCLCGILAAEYDELPDPVKVQVRAFADVNITWLKKVLVARDAPKSPRAVEDWARSIFAAVTGAQLVARSRADIGVFDDIVDTYRARGFIPG